MKKAAVLTIGTEITDGQINNSNSQWISQRLSDFHIPVVLHASAPDDAALIQKTLAHLTSHADLIFISGGLGPTSDDITRDVLSEFVSIPLEFDESAWLDVKTKLQSRNVILREGHRRQCYLPKGSLVFKNGFGVAPGFYFQSQQTHFWVLPGPPPEIESIWNDHVAPQLQKNFSQNKNLTLKTWLCLGAPESELAHSTEEFFADKNFEKQLGYRLQVPYVEIKLWHPAKSTDAINAIELFTEKLSPFYVAEKMEQIHHQLQQKLKSQKFISIEDSCSSGLILERLSQALGPLAESNIEYSFSPKSKNAQTLKPQTLKIEAVEDTWRAQWQSQTALHSWDVPAPSNKRSKWRQHYLVEKLILEWLKVL